MHDKCITDKTQFIHYMAWYNITLYITLSSTCFIMRNDKNIIKRHMYMFFYCFFLFKKIHIYKYIGTTKILHTKYIMFHLYIHAFIWFMHCSSWWYFLFHNSLNQFERDRLNSSRAKFKGYLLIGSWGEAMALNIIFKIIIQNNNLRCLLWNYCQAKEIC